MAAPVPHSVYPEISAKGAIWEIEGGCTRDTQNSLPVQESRDFEWRGVQRPCAYVSSNSTQAKRIRVHGISQREIGIDDL